MWLCTLGWYLGAINAWHKTGRILKFPKIHTTGWKLGELLYVNALSLPEFTIYFDEMLMITFLENVE